MSLKVCSYSVDVAQSLGVHSAVMLAYLSSLGAESVPVQVGRSVIESATGVSVSEQQRVDASLGGCGILRIRPMKGSDKQEYEIDSKRVAMYVKSSDLLAIKAEYAQQGGKTQRPTRDWTAQAKGGVSTDNPVLMQKYCDWLDSLRNAKKAPVSRESVRAQQAMLEALGKGEDWEMSVLDEAIRKCYSQLEWTDTYKAATGKQSGGAGYRDVAYSSISDTAEEFTGEVI